MSIASKLKKRAADLEQKKQYDKALALYLQALDNDPTDDEADVALFNRVGDLMLRLGNVGDALTYYERAVDLYAERGFLNNAIALCNKILRQSPARTSIYYKLGKISATKGFKSDAKKNFLEYADRMQQSGRIDESFRALKEFADLCPDQDDIRLMLAEQLTKEKRPNEALEQLHTLYSKLEVEGRGAEARATLDRMKAIDPDVVPRESGSVVAQKTSDLVFLDLSYESPQMGRPVSRQISDPDLVALTLSNAVAPASPARPVTPLPGYESTSGSERATDMDADTLEPLELEPVSPEMPDPSSQPEGETASSLLDAALSLDGFERTSEYEPDPEPVDLTLDRPLSGALVDDSPESTDDLPLLIDGRLESDAPYDDALAFAGGLLDLPDLPTDPVAETSPPRTVDETAPFDVSELRTGPPRDQSRELDPSRFLEPVDDLVDRSDESEPTDGDPATAYRGGAEVDSDASDASPWQEVGGAVVSDTSPPPTAEGSLDESVTDEWATEWELDGVATDGAANEVREPEGAGSEQAASAPRVEPAPDEQQNESDTAAQSDAIEPEDAALSVVRIRAELEADGANWQLRRRLGEALLESGYREDGVFELERVLIGFEAEGDLDGAQSVAEELIRLNPSSIRHHQKRVEYAVRANDRARLIEAYLELADALFRSGEPDKARVVYHRVADLAPENPRARAALGAFVEESQYIPQRNARPAAAIDQAERRPEPPAPVERGIVRHPDFVDLGEWLRSEEAPKSTRMVVEENAPSGDEQVDFADMLRRFKQGVAENVDEEDYESHYDLGIAYKEMGLLDEAVAEFQKALRGTEHRARTYEALGQCFVEKAQFQIAYTILHRAVASGVGDDHRLVGVLYLLGFACEELEKHTEALGYYQRVFAVDIEFRDVSDRITAMERMAN